MKNILILLFSFFVLVSCAKQKNQDQQTKKVEEKTQEKIEKRYVTIGTGGLTGVYYPTGNAIAKMVNDKDDTYNLKATVESTGGSVFNVNSILNENMDFGIVQSDRQYQAYNGLAEWEKVGPQKDLRSIFSIHGEAVTLVASQESNIQTMMDLKNKKVNIGPIGSGTRQNALDALNFYGLSFENDIQAQGVKPAEAAGFLKDKRIDAFFYTVGHPNGSINEATAQKMKVKIIPISVKDEMLKKYPYYAKVTIPIQHYPDALNQEDIQTFGVKATFCTRENVPEDIVYAFTKEVFENFEEFKKLHKAYSNLTKKDLLNGLSAPTHKGALKYYKEAGLMMMQ